MKFENTYVSREHRYALGVELESGCRYASIPVANQLVDYTETYKIGDHEYLSFSENPTRAMEFIESCRRREQDDRLFLRPGRDRGTPV
jgi:hypothetical protein